MLVYFMTVWNILQPFGIFYGSLSYVVCAYAIFIAFWYVWTKTNLATLDLHWSLALEVGRQRIEAT
jgi:hypothetical protein